MITVNILSVIATFLCLIMGAQNALTAETPEQPVSAEAARYIRRIIFHGNSAMSDGELAELLTIKPGQQFHPQSIDSMLLPILTEYDSRGYMFAKVEWECRSVEKDQITLYINISEGEMVKMGEVELSGNTIFSMERLLSKLDIRKSPIFDDSIFQSDMERLLRLYSENGHPLAKISPTEFPIEDGKLNIKIHIDEGPLVKIRQVKIDGLKKTKARVILREITVRPGDVFDQSEIDESRRRMNNMGYFRTVGSILTPAQSGENSVILSFPVTEGRTGQFSGLLGYSPSEEDMGGQKFTGLLEISEANLLGTGRRMAIRGRFGIIDTYELAYEEPWIFHKPVDVGIRIWGTRQEIQNSGFETLDIEPGAETANSDFPVLQEWAGSLSGTTRVIGHIEGSLAVTYKKIKSPSENSLPGSAGILPASESTPSEELLTGQKYSLTLTVQRDSRDYFINPSTGRIDRAAIEVSRGDFRTIKVWLDLSQYFRTWQRQVLALGIHGARIWGDAIPLTEMLYLGGANTLRGYSEDFFRGEGRLFANCEYRFLVSRDSQFFLFLDSGAIYDKDDGLGQMKLGYGVGMRLKSLSGLVSVDYGLAKGDSVLDGKIHVSLGAMF